MNNLFSDIQRITKIKERQQIDVPSSKSLVIDNNTEGIAILFKDSSSRTGYPIQSRSSFEVEGGIEAASFDLLLTAETIGEHEGVYILSQGEYIPVEPDIIEENEVIFKKV